MTDIKANDTVKVISGKDKGRKGKVISIISGKNAALVERLNFVKRHVRAGSQAGQQGGIIEKEAPIRLDKLMLVCPKCSKPTRTGKRTLDDDTKVRFCKRCDEQIEN
jgi:large subunit ribosomal protein L24